MQASIAQQLRNSNTKPLHVFTQSHQEVQLFHPLCAADHTTLSDQGMMFTHHPNIKLKRLPSFKHVSSVAPIINVDQGLIKSFTTLVRTTTPSDQGMIVPSIMQPDRQADNCALSKTSIKHLTSITTNISV